MCLFKQRKLKSGFFFIFKLKCEVKKKIFICDSNLKKYVLLRVTLLRIGSSAGSTEINSRPWHMHSFLSPSHLHCESAVWRGGGGTAIKRQYTWFCVPRSWVVAIICTVKVVFKEHCLANCGGNNKAIRSIVIDDIGNWLWSTATVSCQLD